MESQISTTDPLVSFMDVEPQEVRDAGMLHELRRPGETLLQMVRRLGLDGRGGQPVRQILLDAIELDGGWPTILHRIASGETVSSLANSYGVSRPFFSWMLKIHVPREEVVAARRASAEAYAEECLQISDTELDDRRARVRIDTRKWFASKLDPQTYGDKATTQIQVNVADLHLQAVRSRTPAANVAPSRGPVKVPHVMDVITTVTTIPAVDEEAIRAAEELL